MQQDFLGQKKGVPPLHFRCQITDRLFGRYQLDYLVTLGFKVIKVRL